MKARHAVFGAMRRSGSRSPLAPIRPGDDRSRMRLSTWASGLALLGASVLTGALVVSIDDGSASDGAVSLASAARSKIALIRRTTDPGGEARLELYVINADGSGSWRLETARLVPPPVPYEVGSAPAWSPDGRRIAFLGIGDDGNADVYVVGADGLGRERLTRDPGVDGNPAWSPDGRKIAFTRRIGEVGTGKTYLYVMNADGSRQRRLTEGHVHFSVAWSPDGRKMLFERRNFRHPRGVAPGEFPEELHVMNADGSGQRRLTRNPTRDKTSVWSPDGRRIAFSRGGFRRKIWLMKPDGSGQRSLTPAGWRSDDPDWSPDGSKIAFGGRVRTAPHDGVLVSNADGGKRRRLTQRGGGPAWSPDGRKIAFHHDGEIFVMNADGSKRRRLTQRGGAPVWSPDGKMIAFDRHDAQGAELYVMTADGKGERRLMRAEGGVLSSALDWAWSPTLPKR